MKFVQLVACMSVLLPLPCSAATYFVSNAGSDSNAGTSSSAPWASLAKVNATKLMPGDRVLLQRGGTWSETLEITRSGAAGSPIAFDSYGGSPASPTILGKTSANYAIDINNAKYVSLTHLSASHALDGVHTNCASNLTIDHMNAEFNTDSGILIAGGAFCKSNNIVIQSNMVDNNMNNGIIDDSSGDNIIVQNNIVHDNYTVAVFGAGIRFVTGGPDSLRQTNVKVLNNNVYHNGRAPVAIAANAGNGIHMDTVGDGMVVSGNNSHDNQQFGIQIEWSGTTGSHVISGNTTTNNLSMGLVIYRRSWGVVATNNVSTGNLNNCVVWGEFGGGDPVGMKNNTFSNNLCYNPSPGGIDFTVAYGADNVKFGSGNTYENNCLGADGANRFHWGSATFPTAAGLVSAAKGAVTLSCSATQAKIESK